MNERLLQFIWQQQYFNHREIHFTNGIPFRIIHPGHYNEHQGPDFNDARIEYEGRTWAGNVELHVHSSDWKKHAHQQDELYRNVIIHVVWIDDEMQPANTIPVFLLQNRVPKLLLQQYESWMNNGANYFPCHRQFGTVNHPVVDAWLEKLSTERLKKRTAAIQELLAQNHWNWEAACWQLIARNFGAKVNSDLFEAVAKTLPVTLLGRHKHQIHALEALLLGQAGLLAQAFIEKYPQMLQKEFQFYKKKYRLSPVHVPVFFLRMRPQNFPTIRLAQLAMLVHQSSALFAFIRDCNDPMEVKMQLMVTANDYWHYHFRFDQLSGYQPKQVGETMMENMMINTIVPMLYAYGLINHQPEFIQKALQWLRSTGNENNRVLKSFQTTGMHLSNAMQSQAVLELKSFYCDAKRCLDCAIGRELLKSDMCILS
jgi:hypothetical protein